MLVLLLGGHIGIIAYTFVIINDREEAVSIAATLLPVTGAILTTMAQYFSKNLAGAPSDQSRVGFAPAFFIILLTTFLLTALAFCLYSYEEADINDIKTIQKMTSLIEMFIAVYLMIFVREIFHSDQK